MRPHGKFESNCPTVIGARAGLVTGKMVQKNTPYDGCAVTDHAEYLGIMPFIVEKGNPMQQTPIGKQNLSGAPKQGTDAFQLIMNSVAGMNPIPTRRSHRPSATGPTTTR